MPRQPRRQESGLTYHVFAKAVREERLYRDDFDRIEFLRLLGETVRAFGWICHAYCEMTTHYHALLTTTEPNIAAGMQALNSRHAEYFNRRHGVTGHLFRSRYGDVVVEGDGHFLSEYRYITRNPVAAGLCDEPDQWRWSSYRATLGLIRNPPFLTSDRTLLLFSKSSEQALGQLRRFVDGTPSKEAA
jgi:REP element-mobilizing transposase RayT